MTKTVNDLKSGDTMVVKRDYSAKAPPREEVIEKIGRVWITFVGGHRVDKTTLRGELLTAYIDMAAYERVILVARLRQDLQNRISRITDEEVFKIAEILGISSDKKDV